MKATLMDLLPYRSITIQYPHEKEALPDNRRGMLGLRRYDHGKD
jgi:formate hydrogenlyase subunit 6/NADH:ubiquinone oxidoreductase subunit I